MIRHIKSKSFSNRNGDTYFHLEIHYSGGFLKVLTERGSYYYKRISLSESGSGDEAIRFFKEYSSYSKQQLEYIQKILLFAFVYASDQLDEAIKNSASKEDLDELKRHVTKTRKHLRYITNYIDSYEELLKEYKDV